MNPSNRNRVKAFFDWVDGEEWCAKTPDEVVARQEKKPAHRSSNDLDAYRRFRRLNQAVGALFCITLADHGGREPASFRRSLQSHQQRGGRPLY